MVVLGIVLIVLAVLFGLGLSVSSSASTTMEVFGVDFGMLVPTVFFLGAAAGAALVVGLWLTKKGLGRGYRRRKEVKELRQQVEAQPATGSTADTEPVAGEPTAADRLETDAGSTSDERVTAGDRLTADERLAADQRPTEDERLTKDERPGADQHTVADSTQPKQPH